MPNNNKIKQKFNQTPTQSECYYPADCGSAVDRLCYIPCALMISASFDNSNSLATQSLIGECRVSNYLRCSIKTPTLALREIKYWTWLSNSYKDFEHFHHT